MPRVVHFEIHASDPERAIVFYAAVFGWNFTRWEGEQEYWVIQTGSPGEPGIDGGLIRRRGAIDGEAVIAYVCTVKVSSVDLYLDRIGKNGGKEVVPKTVIPGMGWFAYAKDTEGNIFGLMQDDPSAE